MGKLGYEDPQLMADVAAVSMARLKEFSSRVLVSIAWDLGTLSTCKKPLLHAIAASLSPEDMACQDVANVAWTFARLIVDDSACKVVLTDAFLHAPSGQFKLQELSNLA